MPPKSSVECLARDKHCQEMLYWTLVKNVKENYLRLLQRGERLNVTRLQLNAGGF